MMDLTGVADSWEELVSTGIVLAQNLDAGRFDMGDLGAKVATVYGDQTLAKFSAAIGIARAHTFREYVRVARGYPLSTRETFLEAGLSWSHFRAALTDADRADLWLARAADEGWPVAALARAIKEATGKPVPPRLLWSGDAAVGLDSDGDRMLYFCSDPFTGLEMHKAYMVKVYESAGQE